MLLNQGKTIQYCALHFIYSLSRSSGYKHTASLKFSSNELYKHITKLNKYPTECRLAHLIQFDCISL